MSVWEANPIYDAKRASLDLAGDLLAGTEAMRGGAYAASTASNGSTAATKWLPRFSSDSNDSYWRRWDRAYLFGAFAEAIDSVTAKVFAEPVEVQGLPEDFEGLLTNADRDGKSLHRFMARHFARVAAFGGSGVLVAMPSKEELPEEAKTPDGDVSTTGAAMFDVGPYFIPVHRMSITDWSWGKRPGGGNRLEFLAIREESRTERQEGKRVEIERLRTWTVPDSGSVVTKLYERKAGDTTKAGKLSAENPIEETALPMAEIPFVWDSVTGPDDEDDPFAVDLPMSELAWLNLQHFRETAEQGIALFMSRAEGLLELGCPDDQVDQPLGWGMSRVKRSTSPPGSYSLQFVGPSGKGVELGEQSLEKIEERMARLGAQPLAQGGSAPATNAVMAESGTDNTAASWARGTEDSFERAFRIADMWARPLDRTPIDKRLPELAVSLKGTSLLDAAAARENVRLVMDAWREGLVEPRVVLEAMVEARILPSDMDLDGMEEWAAQEAVAKLARQMDMFAAASQQKPDQEPVEDEPDDGPKPPQQGIENMQAAMAS